MPISELSPTSSRSARGWRFWRVTRTLRPEQRGLEPRGQVVHLARGEQDRVLDLGALDHAVRADRRVGADVGVGQPRVRADDRRAAHDRAHELGARLDDHAPVARGGLVERALDARVDRVEHEPVGLEHVLEAAGVLPPALDDVRLDAPPASTRCWIASVISSSPRAEGSIARAASWIPAVNM